MRVLPFTAASVSLGSFTRHNVQGLYTPIGDPYGFPLRLRTATKLGFKNPKWITAIEVTNNYPGGFWEDRGFNWFSGL